MRQGRSGALDVAIVGGGLGGLALAAYLRRGGLRPVVLEQASSWDDNGYGIALWRSGLAVLDELGLGDTVRAQGAAVSSVELRGRAGGLERRLDVDTVMVAIHRSALHACLRADLEPGTLVLDARVTGVHEGPDGVLIELADGRTRSCDVVVGADGLSSTVRAARFDDWRREQTGEMAWSWWAPADWRPPEATVELWHRGREAFVADVGGRAVVNVAAPAGGDADVDGMTLLRDTTDLLGWELPQLLAAVDPEDVFSTATERVVARTWAGERCVLIGDAAHAVHPIAGMGATLALADARCLGRLLTTPGAAPGTALARFQQLRHGPVRRAQRLARVSEVLTFCTSPAYARLRHAAVRRTPGLQAGADHLAGRPTT